MKSLALVCGSMPGQGIYRTGVPLYDTLKASGYNITWYQCIDGSGRDEIPREYRIVRGTGLLGSTLSMGINRLLLFPRRLGDTVEDYQILLDPTLMKVSKSPERTIVKIHDLRAFTKYSDKLSTRMMFRRMRPLINKVRAILVNTQYTASILSQHGINNPNVHVIPETTLMEGTGSTHIKEATRRIGEEGSLRLMYVSTDRPYKNIQFFLRLARRLLDSEGAVRFYFDIVTNPTTQTTRGAGELPSDRFKIHTFLDNQALFNLYEQADILLFPSLYEGFGLPILEAMSFGMPIISNNINPMIEILGESGKLIDVERPQDWAGAVNHLTSSSNYYPAARRSLDRFALYTRERFRENVRSVFAKIIGSE